MLQYVSLQPYAKIARVTALCRLTTAQQKGMNMLRIYCSILKCKSTQDTVYQSTVIPLEVCCSPNADSFCPLFLVSNFDMFELQIYGNILLCIASWKYVNPSHLSEDSVHMLVCFSQ